MDEPQRLIVPISDCIDVAYNEMRAALIAADNSIGISTFIEPLVPVNNLSLIHANFIIRLMAEAYRNRAVLYTVVNPVISQPERVVGRTERYDVIFTGRNNGAFGWLVEELGLAELVALPDPGFIPFGGKMIYPPAVVKAVRGVPLSEIGTPIPHECLQTYPIPERTVVHIDNFGLIKIRACLRLEEELGVRMGDWVQVLRNDEPLCTALYSRRIMSLPDDTWVVYRGSSLGGLTELGMARRNGAERAGIRVGDRISFRRIT